MCKYRFNTSALAVASGKFPGISEPNPSYHGISFADACGPAAFVTYIRAILLRDTGACISPFNSFLLLQGIETLPLCLERHGENTVKVVEYLKNSPYVSKVNHPSLPEHPNNALYKKFFPKGGGSIFSFEIKGGKEAAFKFIDNLKIFSILANVACLAEGAPACDRAGSCKTVGFWKGLNDVVNDYLDSVTLGDFILES